MICRRFENNIEFFLISKILFYIYSLFIFRERDREREITQERARTQAGERQRERIPSRVQAVNVELDSGIDDS